MQPMIRYRLAMPEPHSHLLDVRLELLGVPFSPVRLSMPVWTPGSYLVREFSRHVQDLAAHNASGQPVPVVRTDKRTFEVTPHDGAVVVTYKVYANELSVRTNHLDGAHAFVCSAATFLDVEGVEGPIRVAVEPPAGWEVYTSLDAADDEPGTFLAASFDRLVDCPIEVGPHRSHRFTVLGKPHRLVLAFPGNYDEAALRSDIPRIVESAAGIFGGTLPYERYLFVLLADEAARGGLEHADSCVLGFSPLGFRPRKSYEDFLRLVAHEHFHAWNIKRIRPRQLGPFDYSREAYTRMLWLHEGGTVYYDGVIAVRAGVVRTSKYLDDLADSISKLERTEGRKHMSVADSSFNAWIKLYRRDEHTRNSTVSYYLKGELVCLLLDQAIRERSRGQRCLDDVMRALLESTAPPRPGYDEAQVADLLREATGCDLSDLLARYVDGTDELPMDEVLAWYGIEVQRRVKDESKERPRATMAWLGADLGSREGRVVVSSVTEGGPAWRHGLYYDDEIVAMDGYRVAAGGVGERLERLRPEDEVLFSVFRRNRLTEVRVVLGQAPTDEVRVVPRADATTEQKLRFRAWLGQSFPEKS